MADYKHMYLALFNKITDVIKELQELQAQMEEIAINTYPDETEQEDKE